MFATIFSFFKYILPSDELLTQHLGPNLEDQVICDQGFLPLALDNSMPSCKAADAGLVRRGDFIS